MPPSVFYHLMSVKTHVACSAVLILFSQGKDRPWEMLGLLEAYPSFGRHLLRACVRSGCFWTRQIVNNAKEVLASGHLTYAGPHVAGCMLVLCQTVSHFSGSFPFLGRQTAAYGPKKSPSEECKTQLEGLSVRWGWEKVHKVSNTVVCFFCWDKYKRQLTILKFFIVLWKLFLGYTEKLNTFAFATWSLMV